MFRYTVTFITKKVIIFYIENNKPKGLNRSYSLLDNMAGTLFIIIGSY